VPFVFFVVVSGKEHFMTVRCLISCWVVLILVSVPLSGAERRPNILVIVADDLGYADLGFQGCRDIPTPHLDELAKTGVRCTSGYVSHPFCSPTRAGLLTGRYQQRFGHENNPAYSPQDDRVGLPISERTLADALRTAGYVTGAIGKWHLGAAPHFHPLERGFSEYFGLIGGGHDYFQHNLFFTNSQQARAEYKIPLQRQNKPIEENEYLTDALAREATAFVDRHQAEPFFLYLAFNAPHTPLQAKEADLNAFAGIADAKRRTYAAMIRALDTGIGRVLQKLQEKQLADDTLVFFLSDNGGPTQVNGSDNSPLRGAKGQVLEGGIRVPFVVRWPKAFGKASSFSNPVISLDIFPTALAAAGAPLPTAKPLDGVNLLPHLKGESLQSPHETLFWRTGGGTSYAVRKSTYKLVHIDGRDQLFDLEHDVAEIKDLAESKPDVVALLRKTYEDWNSQLMRPLWQNPQGGKKKKKE
jgi:arylsulfatase A-like enzyme